MATDQYLLYESASGYALFDVVQQEEVGALTEEVQKSINDLAKFSRIVKLKAFVPFTSAEMALENINAVSEHEVTDHLKNFLELNLPQVKKKTAKFVLGVIDTGLAQAIQDAVAFPCKADDAVKELIRGVRLHFHKYIKGLEDGNLEQSQKGLGHAYSRAKVKFNPARTDNMIIQSICLLDQLDKDINTFAMRVREWYCWHFPELRDLVRDNYQFARCAAHIGNRADFDEEKLPRLQEILGDEELPATVLQASRVSMGMDTSDFDMLNIMNFTKRMVALAEYRIQLHNYLTEKLQTVAPNLATLVGDMVAARLISKAGSLTSLAKCPASTVQILGAEKALFRALKKKGNTPKYGLIYHSTFIGRAGAKNKGRISRYLANKCSIASRIDSFSEEPTNKYGEAMKEQVEERLKFYDTGAAPRKNLDVMTAVSDELTAAAGPKKEKKKKRKVSDAADDGDEGMALMKKKKKEKKGEAADEEDDEATKKAKKAAKKAAKAAAAAGEEEEPKKKKKKKSEA